MRLSSFVITCLVIGSVLFGGGILFGAENKSFSLTTYFPVPKSDYQTVKTTGKLKIPKKTVGNNTALVSAGEIWLEPS